jgi:hypothetical protein
MELIFPSITGIAVFMPGDCEKIFVPEKIIMKQSSILLVRKFIFINAPFSMTLRYIKILVAFFTD